MLLKVWESIPSMWCRKSLVAPTQCVLLTWSPAPQPSLAWLTQSPKPSALYLSISTTRIARMVLPRGEPDTHSARCQAQTLRPQHTLKKRSSVP